MHRSSKQKTRRVLSISSDKRFAYKQKRIRIEGNRDRKIKSG